MATNTDEATKLIQTVQMINKISLINHGIDTVKIIIYVSGNQNKSIHQRNRKSASLNSTSAAFGGFSISPPTSTVAFVAL